MFYAHQEGLGVPANPQEAQRYLVAASDRGLPEAHLQLADRTFDQNPAKARELYRKAAEQDMAVAHTALGNYHYRGWLEKPDISKAIAHFQKAIELGNDPVAHVYLGIICQEGTGGTKVNLRQAARHFRIAAEAGERSAQVELARCYRDGLGVPQLPVQASLWYQRALLSGETAILEELNAHQKTLTPAEKAKADRLLKK